MGAKPSKNHRVITFQSAWNWKDHFEESKSTNKLMVIDFSASWCGPCRHMSPIFNKFSTKFQEVEFIKIDVEELPDVAREFEIRAFPTFVLMKNGKEIERLEGAYKEELEQKIKEHRR